MSESPCIFLLCSDLMMTSAVSSDAARNGLNFRNVATPNQLHDCTDHDLIIIDLASPGLNLQLAGNALSDHLRRSAVLYGPHVHHKRFEQARDAGFERLMTRGRFNAEVSQIIDDFAAK
ncbi:MAG: hypothetical protein MK110_10135 [Fuerstiella sp.]|nr:hypothetical protein [Fuerstiella sp.]